MKAKATSSLWGMWCCLLVISATFYACVENGVDSIDDVTFPDSDVSYGRHVQPAFDLSCAVSGCHDDFERAGNLSLTSYIDVLQKPGLIIPGDTLNSVMAQVLRDRLPHSIPIRGLLYENQIRGIIIWIQEGASNN